LSALAELRQLSASLLESNSAEDVLSPTDAAPLVHNRPQIRNRKRAEQMAAEMAVSHRRVARLVNG
jgi:hypothetical protein